MRPWRPARRAALVARLRWVLAVALVLAAAASAVRGHRAEAVAATPVLVAAHDLADGHVLAA
jgi:Flp pilus assembly protein CpaB